MSKIPKNIIHKTCKIKLVASDVDGVLTDGGMFYSDKGEIMKKFNTRDGRVDELRKYNIETIFITREKSKIVLARAKKLKIKAYIGILDKAKLLSKICKKYNVTPNEIAYIGDDIHDFEIMKAVGFSASPKNGIDLIRNVANYVCKANGGEGAFREFADLIIDSRK